VSFGRNEPTEAALERLEHRVDPQEVNEQPADNTTSENPKFFVYVVESPSAPDLYHDRKEGAILKQAAALDGIPCVARTCVDREAFEAALAIGLSEAMTIHAGFLPVLHISAHGNSMGIGLSDGTIITWDDLRKLLLPINQSLNGNLLLCMSSCKGYSACRMAMAIDDEPHPYVALFANLDSPSWSDTAVAYATLYHLIAKGTTFVEAIQAMKQASGDQNWIVETADATKKMYTQMYHEELRRLLADSAEALKAPAEQGAADVAGA
jgi:hypothetical protein